MCQIVWTQIRSDKIKQFGSRSGPTKSNSLYPDQARHFVRPDLDPNSLQRLSADDTSFVTLLPVYANVKNALLKLIQQTHTLFIFDIFYAH